MGGKMSYLQRYLIKLEQTINEIDIRDYNGNSILLYNAVSEIIRKVKKLKKSGNMLIFIGNGGSASIASHQAVDYWKNGGIPAIAFTDASLLTCISNDYGYEYVFEKPLNMFSKKGDVLIAMSSSGKSKNIINAVKSAKNRNLYIITMSGFSKSNLLRSYGDLNFYVPSNAYGHVEIIHLILCHAILDTYLNTNF